MKIVDGRGLACPQPVVLTKKEVENKESTEFQVIVDNEVAKNNVVRFLNNRNVNVTATEEKDGNFYISASKGEVKTEEVEACGCTSINYKDTVVFINSEAIGSGSQILGKKLMNAFFYTLTTMDDKPSYIVFMNGGVLSCVSGADTVENIKKLDEQGVRIVCCGTCLDFFEMKDQLEVGEISNMYSIVEILTSHNVITM